MQLAPEPATFLFDLKKTFSVRPVVARVGPLELLNLNTKGIILALDRSYVCLFLPLVTLMKSPLARLNWVQESWSLLQEPVLL